MTLQSAGKPWSHQIVRFQDGTRGERFELRAGDCESRYTDDCRTDRERVEFSERSPGQRQNSEWWYGWTVYLPPDFPATGRVLTKLGQFHQRGDSGPELLFDLHEDALQITMPDPVRWDTDPMNPLPMHRVKDIWPRSRMIGQLTEITMQARWSPDPSGYYRIWINGQLVDAYQGRTTNDPRGEIYFKYGLYRSFVQRLGGGATPPTLVAYYRDVVRAESRAALEAMR
ncbi:polysaccharide lyase [Limimaricola pyoseonensis]|nr:polysaccharide lyase [Limimaricola pyoseonensis]